MMIVCVLFHSIATRVLTQTKNTYDTLHFILVCLSKTKINANDTLSHFNQNATAEQTKAIGTLSTELS